MERIATTRPLAVNGDARRETTAAVQTIETGIGTLELGVPTKRTVAKLYDAIEFQRVVEREPVEDRDRFFVAMLRPLGIEKGKTFDPDARQTKILLDAAIAGEAMAKALAFSKSERFEGARYRPRVSSTEAGRSRTSSRCTEIRSA